MLFDLFKNKKKDPWNKNLKSLGNPGIAMYVKKEHYSDTLFFLEQNNKYHDLTRTNGLLEFAYKEFEYKNEITHCDFSKEPLNDEDTLVLIWCVDKKLQKKK